MNVYPSHIWKQLIIDAPFQWYLREQASQSANFTLHTLREEDDKLEALIDVFRIAFNQSHDISVNISDTGSVFVFMVLGLTLDNKKLIHQVLESIGVDAGRSYELYSALRWQQPNEAHRTLILENSNPHVRQALIATLTPDSDSRKIDIWLQSTDAPVVLRLLYYIGDNRLVEHKSYARIYYDSEDTALRIAAVQAGLLLGDPDALGLMKQLARTNHKHLRTALLWLFVFADENTLSAAIDNILAMKISRRIQALCIGYCGRSDYIERLFPIMHDIHFSQVAAEAFSLVTGVDIVALNLDNEAPSGDEPSAAEKFTIDDQYLRYEEELPWPDCDGVMQWWQKNKANFTSGQRFLAGRITNTENLRQILLHGTQNQRSVAALHLCASHPHERRANTTSRARLQYQELNSKWT